MRSQFLWAASGCALLLAACSGEATTAAPTASVATSASSAMGSDLGMPAPATDEIARLVAEMTIDEKLAQITCIWQQKAGILDENGAFLPEKMAELFPHGAGCFTRPQDAMGVDDPEAFLEPGEVLPEVGSRVRSPAQTVELVNAVQRWMIEETRLGIPTLFHEEGLHGFQGRDATSFPQAIALAATFDPELVEEVYEVVAREIRVRGAHHVLSPVVDVARDPRWGRTEETYGEDPYLVSRMGVAAVRGLQGPGEVIEDDRVLTTLKHMTGHGQPESGTNVGPAHLSERELRDVFFPPFKAVIQEAKAGSVMASYNEIDGIPSHANGWLLNDILRGEWGFEGMVVSDYFAVRELSERHRLTDDLTDAAVTAIKSGVDIELPDPESFLGLKARVESGELSMDYIDRAVIRVLNSKYRSGVFSDPYADAEEAEALTGNAEARALAVKAAHKAMVLLKNDEDRLPLNAADYQRIAVIGPNSDITVLGGYSDFPRQTVSILDGVRAKVGDDVEVVHAKGVTLTDNRSWWADEVNLIDREANLRTIAEAKRVAAGADLVILAVGGDESTSREAWAETHMGDRPDITLIGEQKELVEAIAETGTPIVTVIISGRPLALTNVEDKMPSLIYGWLLGQETGTAVADVLFGDVSPGGKLPVTLPRSVGHLPHFYNHKPTSRRGYAFNDDGPLFPFGFGLSYSSFAFGEPSLSAATITPQTESFDVTVAVTNTGDRDADEVVQVYIRDDLSSITQPVKELAAFERVTIPAGATQNVTLTVDHEALMLWNHDMVQEVEPGTFTIMVGPNSEDLQSTTLTVR